MVRAKHVIQQDQGVRVVTSSLNEAQSMMQAVGFDGCKNVGIPTRRIEAHIGVSEGGDCGEDIERAERRVRRNVQQSGYPNGDQQQFEGIADKSLQGIQLGDMVMWRVGPP